MFEEATERIRSIDYDRIFYETIEDTKDFLLHLIRSQLLTGKRSDGNPIGIYSAETTGSPLSIRYVQEKVAQGLFLGDSYPRYDLYFTGEFHRSIIAEVTLFGDIEIIPTDSKLSKIEEHTNDLSNALELNENYLELYRERILPILQQKINDSLGS